MPKNFEDLAIFPGSELELIRRFMACEGVAESNWLFGSGLDFQSPLSLGSAISLKQFDVIYRNVYRLTNRPGLGMDFGLALNLSRWGMLSSALLCANTLGHALAIADEFKEILRSRFRISNQQEGNMLLIKLNPNPDMNFPVNEIFAYEVFLGSLKTQISQLLAKPFRFSEVKLPYSKPLKAKYYQKISEDPVQFDAPSGQLCIPLGLVQQALPMTNRVTGKMVISQCRDELDRVKKARSGDIVFTVRSMLAQSEGDLPDLPSIASKLSISPRTLRRRLQQEKIQYRNLCEQERQQRAVSLLSKENISLKDISERCGFKDTASFHKAFKRWTGETPARCRQNLHYRDTLS
jgi:AraC-like DNA-binding protein